MIVRGALRASQYLVDAARLDGRDDFNTNGLTIIAVAVALAAVAIIAVVAAQLEIAGAAVHSPPELQRRFHMIASSPDFAGISLVPAYATRLYWATFRRHWRSAAVQSGTP